MTGYVWLSLLQDIRVCSHIDIYAVAADHPQRLPAELVCYQYLWDLDWSDHGITAGVSNDLS